MAISKDEILNAIAEMSVMDVVELIAAMEEKFGVTAAAAVAVAPAAGGGGDAPAVEEKDEFNVVLASSGEKIPVPDTPYDREFWRDVDDEGVGGHFRR